ncbi:hypothetical protein [Arthrobacter sp. efr-133-TYG-104]|uniref:hypothetical protein n=1 Tax=Arthrobacter sp. efr-133-TYG-104 TaxID=3040324 RepID=UPI00254A1775|nr:hypothetical protein [Arthrobacter sp. efr-133-TYG-104]
MNADSSSLSGGVLTEGVLSRGVRSELLRYVSGYSVLGVLAFSGLVPWFVANLLGWPDNSGALSSATNVQTFWALAASNAPVAGFAGSYLVAREAYYGTLRRSVVMSGLTQVFVAKYAAAAVVGLTTAATGVLLWGGSIFLAVPSETSAQLLSSESLSAVPGLLVASLLSSLWGCSLGWIVRNYYATALLTLVVPFALELPLIVNEPGIGRWLPSGALAGILSLPLDHLLPPFPALLVSVAWVAVLATCAALVVKGREG